MLTRMWSNRNTHSWLVGMQNGTATLKDSWAISYKLNMFLPYIPAITLFGTSPNEPKTSGNTKNSMQMFIATLFTIDKAWEQP